MATISTRITISGVPANNATVENVRLQTAGQDLWPGPVGVRVEGNRASP